ncbi:MAG: stage V sporulation protein T, partial [Clostridia bacterium]|nr:stage V sporulation protein T [Clostridia bacterium]
EETYDALEQDLANRITGIRNQMALSDNKATVIRKAMRIARSADAVFDSILQKETPDRTDLHLLADRITVYEDHVEVALKADVDALLRCAETQPPTISVRQASKHHEKCLTACAVAENGAKSPNVISSGDPLEIYTDADGEVIFKKYSPIGELSAQTKQFAEVLNRSTNLPILISDRDRIIACSGLPKRDVLDRRVSAEVETIMDKRAGYVAAIDNERIAPVDGMQRYAGAIYPIIGAGDVSGAVILMLHENGSVPTQTEIKLAQVAASFLGKQMEE